MTKFEFLLLTHAKQNLKVEASIQRKGGKSKKRPINIIAVKSLKNGFVNADRSDYIKCATISWQKGSESIVQV